MSGCGAVDPQQVETAAEAVCLVANGCHLSDLEPEWRRDIMRRYARAAIEALSLTEEHDTEAYFEEVPDSPYPGHSRFGGRRKITRLVGPWRTAQ